MALTIVQHKAASTPPIPRRRLIGSGRTTTLPLGIMRWRRSLTFNTETHHYLGAHYQEFGEEVWKVRRVWTAGMRETVVGGQASWDDAKTAFALYWEAHCEAQRHLLAASAYGKDVVDDQPGETPQVRMTFLHLGRRRKRPSRSIRAS